MGVQIAPCERAIFREKDMPGHAKRHYAVRCAKMAESIEMPFGLWTRVGPRKHVLGGDGHWRNLLNTIAPSMWGGDAAFCQITLNSCYISTGCTALALLAGKQKCHPASILHLLRISKSLAVGGPSIT